MYTEATFTLMSPVYQPIENAIPIAYRQASFGSTLVESVVNEHSLLGVQVFDRAASVQDRDRAL